MTQTLIEQARAFFAEHEYSELYADIAFGRHHRHATDKVAELMAAFAEKQLAEPIPMILHCPKCHKQHIDKPEPDVCVNCGHLCTDHRWGSGHDGDCRLCKCEAYFEWKNPPHHKHLCHGCGHLWTPSLRNTNGVEALKEQT